MAASRRLMSLPVGGERDPNAGHVTLNDKAYNTERNVATGNPYKDLVSDLMKRGVHFELPLASPLSIS
jgi:hypothetical protein